MRDRFKAYHACPEVHIRGVVIPSIAGAGNICQADRTELRPRVIHGCRHERGVLQCAWPSRQVIAQGQSRQQARDCNVSQT